MGASNYVHLSVDEILRETDRAFLVRIDSEDMWLPLSQIADWEDYKEGDKDVTISITEWLAKERGLI